MFGLEFGVVRRAAEAVTAVVGPPDLLPSKKMWRWTDRNGLTVNVHRETSSRATVWLAGDQVRTQGELDLVSGNVREEAPPKNSNCSAVVKDGPTLFAYARHDDEFVRLGEVIAKLASEHSNRDQEEKHLQGNERMTLDIVPAALGQEADTPVLSPLRDSAPEDMDNGTEDCALELDTKRRDVSTQTLDLTVDTLVNRIRKKSLILQPEFQRDYVWSADKASRLIESMLMGVPLPVVYVAEAQDGAWEVVDGQQRLTSINAFATGRFPDGSAFRLGRLAVRPDLRGKTYDDLSVAERNAIDNYAIRAVVIRKDSHPDLKFEVFERLNCGSVQLKDMELRNCMYRGSYNDMLAELAENDFLLKIRRAEAPHKRMDDRQLILRFLAMKRNTHLNYRGSMKQFMNREMLQHRHAPAAEIAEMKQAFESAIECAWTVFGKDAFRRWSPGDTAHPDGEWEGKLNIALWDTLLYTFSFYERRQIVPAADAIREEFLDLMSSDATFVDFIGRTTDKPDRVRYRADQWRRRVDAVVNTPPNEVRAFSRKLKIDLHRADPACRICNQHIQTPEDSEVDHVVHYWRGGPTIPENARLTHRWCNRVRGGRDDRSNTSH